MVRPLGLVLSLAMPLAGMGFGSAGCDHGQTPPQDPKGASSTSAAPTPVAPTASASAAATTSAPSSVASSAPSAKAPLTVPSTWTAYSHKKLALSFSYPKDVFTLTEAAGKVVLASTLVRDELGGDPKPKKWVYGATFFVVTGTPEAYLQKEWKPFWVDANPGGKFKETESLATTTVAGKTGYALFGGVEGYNQRVLALARGKETVVVQLRTIGGVMGPKPDEVDQLHTFDILVASLRLE